MTTKRGFSPRGVIWDLPMIRRVRLQLFWGPVVKVTKVGAVSATQAGFGFGPQGGGLEEFEQAGVFGVSENVVDLLGFTP